MTEGKTTGGKQMNQKELAKEIGVSPQTIANYCKKLGVEKSGDNYYITPEISYEIKSSLRYLTVTNEALLSRRLDEYERLLREKETLIYETPVIGRKITIGYSYFIPQPEAGKRRCLYCWYNSRITSVGGCPYLLVDGERRYPCIDYKLVYYPAGWCWKRWEEHVRRYFSDVDEREKEDI